MSYDVTLCDPVSHETIEFAAPHQIAGGTYAVGGTTEGWLSITYNYSHIFQRVIGKDGIRTFDGMSAAKSIPILESAISQLGDDVSNDYWEATEGNAKRSLHGLLAFAQMRPDGVWEVF